MTFVSKASTIVRAFGNRAIHVLHAYGAHARWRRQSSCKELINAQRARAFGNPCGFRGVLGNFESRLLDEPEALGQR